MRCWSRPRRNGRQDALTAPGDAGKEEIDPAFEHVGRGDLPLVEDGAATLCAVTVHAIVKAVRQMPKPTTPFAPTTPTRARASGVRGRT